MAVRILVLISCMLGEMALAIVGIIAVVAQYPYRVDEEGTAMIVLIVFAGLVCWLLTVAGFLRKAARVKARRIIDEARDQAARILGEATERALALTSMEYGKCRSCGNPRTGKYCPKCGQAAVVM